MKKICLVFGTLVLFSIHPAYALFGLITRDDLQLVKAQIENQEIKLSELVKVNAKLDSRIEARLVAYDRSVRRETNVAGNIGVWNSPEVFRIATSALLIICLALIFALWRVMRRLLHIIEEKKEYKSKYYKIKNGN